MKIQSIWIQMSPSIRVFLKFISMNYYVQIMTMIIFLSLSTLQSGINANMSLYTTILTVCLFFLNVLAFVAMYVRSRKPSRMGKKRTYCFFHPYCNAGGGGERVLWTAVQTVQERSAVPYLIECENHECT